MAFKTPIQTVRSGYSAVPDIPGQLRAPIRQPDGQPGGLAVEAALLVHLAQPPPSTNGGRLAAKSRAPVRFGRASWSFAPMGAPGQLPARLVAADRAKQLFAKPNCTSTYGTSSQRGERRRLPRELFLCTP